MFGGGGGGGGVRGKFQKNRKWVVVEENNRNVVVWLCYSRSCVEINFECGLDVGSMW